jgi:MtN3 and saliva related transmembrane protein
MTSSLVTTVGGVAALASTVSFVPQAVKIIRTRDASAISTGMYIVTVVGFMLWTTYGALLGQWPIMASNGICLALSAFILSMKLLPKRKVEEVAEVLEPVVGREEPGAAPERSRRV